MATQRRLISSTERDIADVTARMSAIGLESGMTAAYARSRRCSLTGALTRGYVERQHEKFV